MSSLLLISGLILFALGVIWKSEDILNTMIKVLLLTVAVLDLLKWAVK